VVRCLFQIEMNGLTLVAGILALLAGTGAVLHVDLPLIPIALIVIGSRMLLVSEVEDHPASSPTAGWRCCG
jgi:hypothetical protein